MSNAQPNEHCFTAEFATLVGQVRDHRDAESRSSLFTALVALERRAGLAEVSDGLLRRIAEARFLAGILRDSVLPVDHLYARGVRRVLTVPPRPLAGEPDCSTLGAV